MSLPVFETPRLLVRPLRSTDFASFFEMQSNPKVHRYTGSPVEDKEAALASLKHCIACYDQPDNDWWIWAIVRKDDGAFVGTAAIIQGNCALLEEGPEIGYRFLEKHWGNGYASEICNPLIDHAMFTMQLPSVFAQADVRNKASVKILDQSKLNFVDEYYNEKDKCMDRVYYLSDS